MVTTLNLGWECPKCGKVWAPSITECSQCNAPPITTTTDNINANYYCPRCGGIYPAAENHFCITPGTTT